MDKQLKIEAVGEAIEAVPQRPLHPRCRCTTTVVLKSWKELGIKAKEFPPSTRASMSGQVPETTTYSQWLKQQEVKSPGFAKDVLGPTRYKLWKEGKIKLTEMAKDGKILSVEQLKRKAGKAPSEMMKVGKIVNVDKAIDQINTNWSGEIQKIYGRGTIARIEEKSYIIRGCFYKDKLAGVTSLLEEKLYVAVDRLGAGLPDAKGVGTRLMAEAAKFASSKGKGLRLSSVPDATGFYKKIGMKQIGRSDFEWTANECKEFWINYDAFFK